MSLSGVREEDLKNRWESLLPQYVKNLGELKRMLFSIGNMYEELSLIREELSTRDIEVNDECLEEMKKIS